MDYGIGMQFLRNVRIKIMPEKGGKQRRMVWAEMAQIDREEEEEEMPSIWELVEFALQTLAIGLFQMEATTFFLPISIDNVRFYGRRRNGKEQRVSFKI
jgi:hypothetical protein